MEASRSSTAFLYHAARILAGVLLLAAGAGKLWDPAPLIPSLTEYLSVPVGLAGGAVALIAAIECATGVWILFRPGLAGSRLAFLLAASFVTWTAYLLLVQADVPCGCFGGFDAGLPVGWLDLVKSTGVLAMSAALVRGATRNRA